MYILGISCYYHDSAVALIQDGNLIAATEEDFARAFAALDARTLEAVHEFLTDPRAWQDAHKV